MRFAPGLAFALAIAAAAHATDIRVTKLTDSDDGACDADCSLREAVSLANAQAGADRILLREGVYHLSLPPEQDDDWEPVDEDANANGDLDVAGDLTISGKGADATSIDGGGIDRVMEIMEGAHVYLRTLTVTHGHTADIGAGIENRGELTIWSVAVRDNDASSQAHRSIGGGISNTGVLNVYASTIDGNGAEPQEVSFGRGGGIYNAGTLTMRETTVSNNHSNDDDDFGRGGGIYNTGSADIARSAFVGNFSPYGAAFSNGQGGVATLSNVTVSGNTADPTSDAGAAIGNEDPLGTPTGELAHLKLSFVTVAGNSGYGVSNRGTLVIRDTIVAGNHHASGADTNCINFERYSGLDVLLGSEGAPTCAAGLTIDNAETFETLLYPLADNGGRTPTHALRPEAIAIDAVTANCPAQDQRSVPRPFDGDGDGASLCDLGAYERDEL